MGILRSWTALAAASTIGLASCTYVTRKDVETKFACLDEDGDGAVKEDGCTLVDNPVVDCDDGNSDRFPGNPEVPYDGTDQDCDHADLLDLDSDGFPGVLEADWQSNDGDVSWPGTLDARLDCDEANASIFPGSNAEVPYDGVNSDCDDRDDYDFDGDGYVIAADRVPEGLPAYTGPLPGGDCDDNAAAVNPGVPSSADLPYDEVDSNCDGANDFDVDGDTWMRVGDEAAFQRFVTHFGYTFDTLFGDCNDDEPTIYPGAADTWYDAVDSNCDGADDYDQDGDGFIVSPLPNGAPAYDGALATGDCNDTVVGINPEVIEGLGDGVDQNCDGGADTAPFQYGAGYGWDRARPPVIGATDQHYLIVTAADTMIEPSVVSSTTRANFGVALQFDKTAGWDATPSDAIGWQAPTPLPFGAQLDAVFAPDRFYIAANHQRPLGPNIQTDLRVYRLTWSSSQNLYSIVTAPLPRPALDDPYLGLDLEVDATQRYVVGACAGTTIQVGQALTRLESWTPDGSVFGQFAAGGSAPQEGGHACYVDVSGTTPNLVAFGDTGVHDFTGDVAGGVLSYAGTHSDLSNYAVNSAVHDGAMLVLAGSNLGAQPRGVTVFDGAATVGTFLPSDEVIFADAQMLGTTLYVVAVVADRGTDGRDDVILLYGVPPAMTEVVLPFAHPDRLVDPTSAGIYADSSRVIVSVAGVDADPSPGVDTDVLGWVFYTP